MQLVGEGIVEIKLCNDGNPNAEVTLELVASKSELLKTGFQVLITTKKITFLLINKNQPRIINE